MRSAALALCLLAVGCTSNKPTDDAEQDPALLSIQLDPPPNKTIELEEFKFDWEDLEKDERGRRNPYDIARWATERHDQAEKCMREEPPARKQAIKLLKDVMVRVPDASKSRILLAQVLWQGASYWFKAADAMAYNLQWIQVQRVAPRGGPTLTDAQIAEAVDQGMPQLRDANKMVKIRSAEALKHFQLYRAQRPDDKRVLDFIWKLHFFLQEYRQCLRALEHLLAEIDAQGIGESDPARRSYEDVRERLQHYLAELEIDGVETSNDRGGSVLPWEDKKGRELRKVFHAR